MKATKQQREWIRALEKLRFDIVRRDPLQGHKEYGTHTSVDIHLDDSGQIRLVVTRLLDSPKGEERKARSGREFKVFQDRTHVTLVNYKLQKSDDVEEIVKDMEQVAS